MASERKQERRSIWRVGPESTRTTVLPVAFIIISLVSLAALPTEVFSTRLFERHPKYEDVVKSADALETAIQNAIDDRYHRIRDAERLNVTLTVVLTLLALTSALLVAGLGRQMRLLAREAMRRRRDAEREAADAKIARATAEREERRGGLIVRAAPGAYRSPALCAKD